MGMGSAITRLLIILNDEDMLTTDYVIANQLIQHFSEIPTLSIADVSEYCNVSKSKMSKFIRKIGYEDYHTFKSEIVFHSRLQDNMNFSHILSNINQIGFEEYVEIIRQDLQQFKVDMDISKIDVLAGYLDTFKKVAAFGTLHSAIAALQLQFRLAYKDKFIITQMNETKQNEFILQADEDTLIIIFSDTGNYIGTQQLQEGNLPKKIFEKTKAKIVLITSNQKMAKSPLVDLCITYSYSTVIHTYSVLYSIITDLIAYRYDLLNAADK